MDIEKEPYGTLAYISPTNLWIHSVINAVKESP